MENATKALLIAAGVLVVILIISLGLMVLNIGKESMGNINLTEAEITQFNSKFDSYAGTNVSGSKVNTMLKAVFSNNLSESDDSKKVTVKVGTTAVKAGGSDYATNSTLLATNATSSAPSVATGKAYTVTLSYDSKSGLITTITISTN